VDLECDDFQKLQLLWLFEEQSRSVLPETLFEVLETLGDYYYYYVTKHSAETRSHGQIS